MFIMPASHSFFRAPGRASTLPVSLRRQAAVTMRLAVWENRPGGVLCVERAELNVAPFAAELEHLHLLDLQAAALQALQPLRSSPGLQGCALRTRRHAGMHTLPIAPSCQMLPCCMISPSLGSLDRHNIPCFMVGCTLMR